MGVNYITRCALLLLFSSRQALGLSCDIKKFFGLRQRWASSDDPCHQKLAFELWLTMMGEGSNGDADAKHVLKECVVVEPVNMIQLSVDDDWDSEVGGGCGKVMSKDRHSATYRCSGVEDLEELCHDIHVTSAARANALHGRYEALQATPGAEGEERRSRRLQSANEAVAAHEIEALHAGLEELGCANTRGDGLTFCVMSDSFDAKGYIQELQDDRELPDVEVVLDYDEGSDEGAAMIDLAYDIAPNAIYKFHTAFLGEQSFADGILTLAEDEGCDVIVEDVSYPDEPSFRDGVIAQAIDSAVLDYGALVFDSAGNEGLGKRFASNLECTTALFEPDSSDEPCDEGVASHVFDDSLSEDDPFRYLAEFEAYSGSRIFVKWDEDDDDARTMAVSAWRDSGDGTVEMIAVSSTFTGRRATATLQPGLDDEETIYFAVHQLDDTPSDLASVEVQVIAVRGSIPDATDSGMFGGACASSVTSVAAISHEKAGEAGGVFSDPETSSVETYSSRGTCLVDASGTLEERLKPEITAVDGLSTAVPGFENFMGTSAAAPIAAAIMAVVRAACAPSRVVGRDDVLDIFSNYDYTIDYTSDAEGDSHAFGDEAGYGIISGSKILSWIEANCAESCPGGAAEDEATPATVAPETPAPVRSTPAPVARDTPAPVRSTPSPVAPETPAPVRSTPAPVARDTPAPVRSTPGPVAPETPAPVRLTPAPVTPETPAPVRLTQAPVTSETPAPVRLTPAPVAPETPTPERLTPAPVAPDTPSPVRLTPPPTPVPVTPDTPPPVRLTPPPTPVPVSPDTPAPVVPDTPAPVGVAEPPSASPVLGGSVEVGSRTTVTVSATGYDHHPGAEYGDTGCFTDGCLPELTRDGDESNGESRWSCMESITYGEDQCEIRYEFDEPQDVVGIEVSFFMWDVRSHRLKVSADSSVIGDFQSSDEEMTARFDFVAEGVTFISLESLELAKDDWIALLEVRIYVQG